jgi:ADP-heptose:LPS heptosyltransferase
MSTILERLPLGSRVAVIRLRSLGDCVLTTPAISLLKAYRPDLRIAVVVEPRFRAVFERNSDVERLLDPQLSAIFSWHPKLILNLHGGTHSMALTLSSGAPLRAGFGHHRYSAIYSHRIPRAQEILGEERTVHTAEHLASAMFWLGVPREEIPRAKLNPDVGRPPACATHPGRSVAVFHPFASQVDKTWPPDRFLALADDLNQTGLEPIILAGPTDDPTPFAGRAVCNNAPLADIISLMARAQLFMGNDSGPAHIAAAFGVPTVVLFGSSNPAIWAPWRTEARVLHRPEGIRGIEVSEVLDAIHSFKVAA